MSEKLTQLDALRASGAISDEQYQQLSAASPRPPTPTPNARPEQLSTQVLSPDTPSLLRIAGAAAGGALAGSLAADLVRNALSDPPPEVLEAHIASHTTYTDDGYVTEGSITWENADGEVVAEDTFVDEGAWVSDGSDDDAGTWEATDSVQQCESTDFGGMEF